MLCPVDVLRGLSTDSDNRRLLTGAQYRVFHGFQDDAGIERLDDEAFRPISHTFLDGFDIVFSGHHQHDGFRQFGRHLL